MEVTRRWKEGDLVQKRQKSKWRGRVVGFYSTAETLEGYNVESLFEPGSCQLWPLAALDDWDGTGTPEQLEAALAAKEAELAAKNEELARMREALRPFAIAADAFPEEKRVIVECPTADYPRYYLVARDLHRARAALGDRT